MEEKTLDNMRLDFRALVRLEGLGINFLERATDESLYKSPTFYLRLIQACHEITEEEAFAMVEGMTSEQIVGAITEVMAKSNSDNGKVSVSA